MNHARIKRLWLSINFECTDFRASRDRLKMRSGLKHLMSD